ncbi:MAG: tRNA lysidine(34) synthetase TilS [Candidatus Omnitrophota bacterium]|jgi:tRNA(Ile)-lysidine synthase
MDITAQVKANMIRKHLVRKGDTLLVGVSGGSDSIALLHVLRRLQHILAFRLLAVHFNHQLRADASGDEKFVEQVCRDLNVSCQSIRLTIKRTKNQSSLEDNARQARLRHLGRLSEKHQADKVVLAHHRDDCAETVLMHILRGAGLQGLKGIPPQTELNSLTIIRPFYNISKNDILRYLRANKIKYREDSTNQDDYYFRNAIRKKLLPYIEKNYQPKIRELLFQLASLCAEDYNCLALYGQKYFKRLQLPGPPSGAVKLHQKKLAQLHPSLQRVIYRLAYENLQGDLTRLTLKHAQEIEDLIMNRKEGASVHWPNGITVCKETPALIFKRRIS